MIDTHCHLDVAAFEPDRGAVLQRTRAAGVRAIVVPGIDAAGWKPLLALCDAEPDLFPALGLHPLFMQQHRASDLQRLEQALATVRPVAVGEIGLDFHAAASDPAQQQRLCAAQLCLARDAGLPVLLHVRKAHDAMLALLRQTGVRGGIAHAFNGSLQQAQQYVTLGFKLGFGGMLTFERSARLRRLARELPLEAIVLETDAPDLTVASHRFQRNSPEYLPEVLSALAAARDADPESIAAVTTANAREVLGLDAPWHAPEPAHHD
ncbi:TatD family deoxyribonuclease [Thiohalocapsa marina]|uniref:TatD family deoxyribonuclease n=1 Tax=Thiohalocapsa marina TaxID=424902 RepID=A0A5M8FN40_9GAMM|nr:TatD family deoxyribonuclease [Thiohalocapsa marina]